MDQVHQSKVLILIIAYSLKTKSALTIIELEQRNMARCFKEVLGSKDHSCKGEAKHDTKLENLKVSIEGAIDGNRTDEVGNFSFIGQLSQNGDVLFAKQ